MHFNENFTYHIFNRSNETIFKTRENYIYFLQKFRNYVLPYADVLAWCLMPNHFHFMLSPNKEAVQYVPEKYLPNTQVLSKQFGTLLSSYTKAFNKQNNRKGSLFAHNTEAKELNEIIFVKDAKHFQSAKHLTTEYTTTCFKYIHLNPILGNLVDNIEDWEFSSYHDYANIRKGSLINKELVLQIVNYDIDDFKVWSLSEMNNPDLEEIFL